MRKKIIGYCTATLRNEAEFELFKDFHKKAYENNYGVITICVGRGVINESEDDVISSFYMLNLDLIDALVVDATYINNLNVISQLCDAATEKNIPSVVINGSVPGKRCLVYDTQSSFNELINHLIKEHNCKTMALILGFEHKWDSDSLIRIVKDNFAANNLSFDESMIGYGEYWDIKSREPLERILENTKPDAIVCANDVMAMEACRVVAKLGYRVPEDVIVTGIDGMERALYFNPSITSVNKSEENLIECLFEELGRLMYGNPEGWDSGDKNVKCSIRFGLSCGCCGEVNAGKSEKIDSMYNILYYNLVYDDMISKLTGQLMNVSSVGDISGILGENMPQGSCICVRETFMQDLFGDVLPAAFAHNSKFYILASSNDVYKSWGTFNLAEIIPDLEDRLEKDIPTIIFPVKYQNTDYGYLVTGNQDYGNICLIMERYVKSLEDLLGRYTYEKKLRFASSELFHVTENMRQMQIRDIITGLYNNQGLVQEMESLKGYCVNTGEKMIVVCMDLDRLGAINDAYGHSEGDIAIQNVASIIQDSVLSSDITAHLGSDEFVVVFHTKENPDEYMKTYLSALDNRLDTFNSISGKDYSIELNQVYIVVEPTADTVVEQVVDDAFNKKREEKNNKRNIHGKELSKEYSEKERLIVNELIDSNRFKYAYQPIVYAKNGDIYGYEALMRSEEGVSPLEILKYATYDNRLYDIERATFNNVLAQVMGYIDELNGKKIFINSIPGSYLDNIDYSKIKRKYSAVFGDMVVEITEQTEMDDDNFELLRKRSNEDGFEVAVDDFGSGYSNTANLLKYLPNCVKIDRLLISDIHKEPRKQHFVNNIIEFAHDNGFLALAEGVETFEELNAVIKIGVDLIQGYYTAKPGFDFIDGINGKIRKEIQDINMANTGSAVKKMYVVGNESEVNLMHLVLEKYTGIVVSQEELVLTGNKDFSAHFNIKIRDYTTCRLHIRDVCMLGDEKTPCIELGKNSTLYLCVEGDNELLEGGIRVPDGSNLIIEGEGDIRIECASTEAYGIGAGWDDEFGNIRIALSGKLNVHVSGNKCVAIGGGKAGGNGNIAISSGEIEMFVSAIEAVAVGTAKHDVSIDVNECSLSGELKVAKGTGLGSYEGTEDIKISNTLVDFKVSGNSVCGIGNLGYGGGKIRVSDARCILSVNAKEIIAMGNRSGNESIELNNCRIDIEAEGALACGMGNFEKTAVIKARQVAINMAIRSAQYDFLGANEEYISFDSVATHLTTE